MDITELEDVWKAFADAKAHFGRVVFNNAGTSHLDEIEGTSEAIARSMFDVNFWRAAKVTKEADRFFQEKNNPQSGVLLQNSLALGRTVVPCIAFYVAARWGT